MSAVDPIAAPLAVPLERLRQRYARSAVPGFLRWWGTELAALVPARWRARLLVGERRVLYRRADDALCVSARSGSGADPEHELARLPLGDSPSTLAVAVEDVLAAADHAADRPRWLVLPAARVLRRRIMLPAAATERLRDVLGFELDRQTPFRADQVSYDYRLLARHDASRQIEVELVVLTLADLDAALAPLGALADGLAGVTAVDEHDQPLPVNLLPRLRRWRRRDHGRGVNLALLAFAVVALWFALWQTLDNQRAAVAELQTQVAARRAEAAQVQVLRAQLTDATDGTSFLARMRAASPTVLELLADLSARLPDHTWLEKLSLEQGRLVLVALSPEAPALVAQLQASKLLRAPALSGSVQADPGSGNKRATLVAELADGPTAPAARDAADGTSTREPADGARR